MIAPFAIVFLTGFNSAAPGYGWAVAYQPFHGVFLDNILFAGYLVIAGVPKKFAMTSDAIVYPAMIALVATLVMVSAAFNPMRAEDVGQAMRLVLLAAYTLHAVNWTRATNDPFVLRTLLIGMGVAGAANIYVSFAHPYLRIGYLPALYARNGTGGPLGLGVALGAWLYLIQTRHLDKIVSLIIGILGLFAAFISFSKTSMLVALCGIPAWIFVLGHSLTRRGLRIGAIAFIVTIAAAVLYLRHTEEGQNLLRGFRYSLSIKFASAALRLNDQASTQWRYQYFWAVGEIVTKNPLLGVSPSGFYDALVQTEPFKAGLMGPEDPEARTQGGANPHNSFLYIASSHGIPGLFLGAALYTGFLAILRRRLKSHGLAGLGVFWCIAASYFIFGMTLPSLFNTMILYLPAAAAIGMTRMATGTFGTSRELVNASV